MLNFYDLIEMIGKPVYVVNDNKERWGIVDWVIRGKDYEEFGFTDGDFGYDLKKVKVYRNEEEYNKTNE